MTARVITDPSALGWVLDPDTGRWEWSGSGDGGGVEEAPEDGVQYARQDAAWSPIESGGGGAWDVIERVDLAGANQYDFDEFPDTHTDFMFKYQIVYGTGWNSGNGGPWLYVKVDGDTNIMSGSNKYSWNQFLPSTATGSIQGINHIPLVWSLSNLNRFAAGYVHFYDANEKYPTSRSHHLYGSSVSFNKIQNFSASIDTSDPMSTDERALTGFRIGNLNNIESGYICLMGIRKEP